MGVAQTENLGGGTCPQCLPGSYAYALLLTLKGSETRQPSLYIRTFTVLCRYWHRTAVCIDLAKCEPKSCADEYNCVVRLPIQQLIHLMI